MHEIDYAPASLFDLPLAELRSHASMVSRSRRGFNIVVRGAIQYPTLVALGLTLVVHTDTLI
jgi:hypothetical protein